jgi:hypothetical protein
MRTDLKLFGEKWTGVAFPQQKIRLSSMRAWKEVSLGLLIMFGLGFVFFFIFVPALKGLIINDGWARLISALIVLGFISLFATTDFGKALLASFFLGIGLMLTSMGLDSSESLIWIPVGVASLGLAVWLGLRVGKNQSERDRFR